MSKRLLGSLIVGALVAGESVPAAAQERRAMSVQVAGGPRGGMGDFSPTVSKKDLERFGKIVEMDAEQMEIAETLREGYAAEYGEAAKEIRAKMEKIREEFQETRDPAVWMDFGTAMGKFRERGQALEDSLMNDIKQVLTEKQTEKWPKVERTHRRTKFAPQGFMSGESVDLVEIVQGLEIGAPLPPELAEALDRYELELDKALVERNTAREKMAPPTTGRGGGGGPGGFTFNMEALEEATKASQKVQEVNDRHAKSVESVIPEDHKAAFNEKVKRETYPRVYRESYATKALKAAEAMAEVDSKTKESLAAIRGSYERELGAANERWAKALRESEASTTGGMFGGGMAIMMGGMGDDDSELSQARKARRELDNSTIDKVHNLLTEEQREQLPERGAESEGEGFRFIGG